MCSRRCLTLRITGRRGSTAESSVQIDAVVERLYVVRFSLNRSFLSTATECFWLILESLPQEFGQHLFVYPFIAVTKQKKTNIPDGRKIAQHVEHSVQSEPHSWFQWVAKSAWRDGRKGDGSNAMLFRWFRGITITPCQQPIRRFIYSAHWTRAEDNIAVSQIMRAGGNRLARPDRCKGPALRFQPWSRSSLDSPCDSAPDAQLGVGPVHDGFHVRLVRTVSLSTLSFRAV